ncbi:MAG: NADH-quinone oxidoreductase subunit I [bacterium]|nr:NADH-quinone oxidoreductase subunit I [bacterium]
MKINRVISSIIEFIRGLSVTFWHLFVPSVTLQYPRQRWTVSDRYRGLERLAVDEEGRERCVGCCLCAQMCPSNAIKIVTGEGKDYNKEVISFEIDIARCLFCGLCVEACPKNALSMTGEYELACYNRAGMIYTKEGLYKSPDVTRYKK